MAASLLTSIIAYTGTNIDDIFVIMILLAQAAKSAKGKLVAGHFLGVGIITVMSMLGAFGLQNLPLKYVGILGMVPIGLGIKAYQSICPINLPHYALEESPVKANSQRQSVAHTGRGGWGKIRK